MKLTSLLAFFTFAFAAQAQDMRRIQFTGIINDYSPASLSGGPWEFRGDWSLDVATSGTANFSAAITMMTSDYGVTSATQVDPNNPLTRSPHTHHINVTNATVSYDTSVCPANSPTTTGSGVVVTGTSTISANAFRIQRRVHRAGLHHWRVGDSILELYAGIYRPCHYALRDASFAWRRAESNGKVR